MKKLILFAISLALLLSGCVSSEKTGNFQIYLKDQPIDADEILVTISDISVQKQDEGFLSIWSGEETYDLLKLQKKEKKIIDVNLEAGTYTQIRLVVTAGQIVFSDEDKPEMIVPSSEVKIPLVFNITAGGATEILLDFEAEHSIQVMNAGQSEQYILRPVIRVVNITY